jgi:hypothetical protein
VKPVWEYVASQEQINAVLLIGRQWLPISVGSWTVGPNKEVVAFQTEEGNAFVKGSAVLGVREDVPEKWDPPIAESDEVSDYDRIFGGHYSKTHPFPRFK